MRAWLTVSQVARSRMLHILPKWLGNDRSSGAVLKFPNRVFSTEQRIKLENIPSASANTVRKDDQSGGERLLVKLRRKLGVECSPTC